MGTPSHLGHMDRVAATMPSQAHAGAAQEAPDIGQWEGQDVCLVRPSSCNVKGGIPSSRRYLPTYLWVYIDGSEKKSLTGAAAVFFPHNSPAFAIAIPSPFRWSGDAEFWALLSCLRLIRTHSPATHICILPDNSEVVSVYEQAVNKHFSHRPKSETHCYSWLMAFSHQLLHIKALVEVSWLKAHVGFLGNEIADALAKWIYFSCPPSLT